MQEFFYVTLLVLIVFVVTRYTMRQTENRHVRWWRALRFPVFLITVLALMVSVHLERTAAITKQQYQQLVSLAVLILPTYFILYTHQTGEAITKSGFVTKESNPVAYLFSSLLSWGLLAIFLFNLIRA